MKALKVFALTIAALAAILAGVTLFFDATFDAGAWKSEITRIVKEKTQRTLKLEGELTLSFWPRAGIALGRTTLSERGSEQAFAALDKAQVSLALLPLLRKRVVADRVELSGVMAKVVRAKDGSLNIDDLISKDEQAKTALDFDVAGIDLEMASLSYRDEGSGKMVTLSNATLSTGSIGSAAEGQLKLAGRLTGERPTHNADVSLSGLYRYDREHPSYAVTKLDAKVKGDWEAMKGVEIALAAGRLELNGAARTLEVERLALSAQGVQGQDSYEVELEWPSVAIAGNQANGGVLDATVKVTGARRRLDAKLNLSGLEGSATALKIARLVLDLDATYTDTAIKGTINSPLHANLAGHTVELPQLEGELSLGHPMIRMKRVELRFSGGTRGDWGKQTASGELAARVDESSINARWTVPTFSPPALRFDIEIDRFNADRYFKPEPARAASAGHGHETPVQKPLDFTALDALNASGSIRIGSLQLQNTKAVNVRLDVESDGGKPD